ncbi:hypothetical protein [Plastoroseomonas hellenica]|uniref:Uncharacterized protein n=1 Tax=Plastoroseomonas hellenica TaxID=2687306 RepID=A0ABS5F1Q2_9PROT|nr:hypothetical protein [Plastoroseomonas hellenica]MBR0641711.1 hypothetical protein [Plastoroseomonas hellenica]MBR0666472.1 hypothetical protein [Plastoroseomonas hellenica]
MMRGVLLAAGWVLMLLALGAAVWGVTFWTTALEIAPDRMQGHTIWISAEMYVIAAIGFAALGLLCLGLAEVLYRLPR